MLCPNIAFRKNRGKRGGGGESVERKGGGRRTYNSKGESVIEKKRKNTNHIKRFPPDDYEHCYCPNLPETELCT